METTLPPAKPKRHKGFLIFFLLLQALFLIWVIAGGINAQGVTCEGLSTQDCKDAKDIGTTIGVGLIIALWAATDIIIGGTYAVYRLVKGK